MCPNSLRRRFEKLVLPSIFDTSLFILEDVKLAELFNNSFDIFFFLGGAGFKTHSDLLHILRGQDPQPL